MNLPCEPDPIDVTFPIPTPMNTPTDTTPVAPERPTYEQLEAQLADVQARLDHEVALRHARWKQEDAALTRQDFAKELEQLINCYSEEQHSNTPDFILAKFLLGCMDSFNSAVVSRDAHTMHG